MTQQLLELEINSGTSGFRIYLAELFIDELFIVLSCCVSEHFVPEQVCSVELGTNTLRPSRPFCQEALRLDRSTSASGKDPDTLSKHVSVVIWSFVPVLTRVGLFVKRACLSGVKLIGTAGMFVSFLDHGYCKSSSL